MIKNKQTIQAELRKQKGEEMERCERKIFFFLQTGYVSLEVTWLGKLQDTMQGLKSIKEAKE